MRQKLIDAYLDYVNNYVSVETWAEHNGLSIAQGYELIRLARQVANDPHSDA